MGTSYNPKIVTDGLVLNLDPANVKSYPANQDPFVNNVSLMLSMDGANNSTTFTDSSQNALAATRFGTPVISTTQSKFGGSSAYFNGTSDYITYSSATLFDFSGDFTIEGFWYFSQINQDQGFTILFCGIELDRIQLATVSGGIELYWGGLLISYSIASSSFLNTWTHVAVTRSGTAVKLWINGVNVASATKATAIDVSGLSLAKQLNNGIYNGYFNGYIDEFRVTKGICRYTSTFTPPTAPFSLPGRLTDLTKNKSIGTFISGPTYNASNGGSVVLAGSTALDYITIPDSELWTLSSTDFSIFIWANLSTLTQVPSNRANSWPQAAFISQDPGGGLQNKWIFSYDTYVNQMVFHANSTSGGGPEIRTGTVTISANQWYSFGITRIGTTYIFYLNGVSVGSSVSSYTIPNSTAALNIGYGESTSSLSAKISNVLFYRKGLTSNEVLQNYNATKGRFG